MSEVRFGSAGAAARLRELADIRLRRAELDARETELLAALAAAPDPYGEGRSDLSEQWIREDVACALRIPSATALAKLRTALELTSRFPATVRAMRAGVLDARYADRLVEATAVLDDVAADEVQRRVLRRAGQQTFAQFAASVRCAVCAVDVRPARERERVAREDRRVVFRPV